MAVGGEERQTWAKSKVKRITDKEAEQFSSLSMVFQRSENISNLFLLLHHTLYQGNN